MKTICLTTGLVLLFTAGLTACNEAEQAADTVPPPEVVAGTELAADAPDRVQPAASQTITATIDWEAANRDRASNPQTLDAPVSIQSANGERPPVPVLLPSGIVTIASADGSSGPHFRPLEDGYFATYPGAVYDIIVNGTNLVSDVEGRTFTRNDEMVFTTTVAGAHVSLSRYGADYLIEFECHNLDDVTATCIGEEEALSVAETLLVAG